MANEAIPVMAAMAEVTARPVARGVPSVTVFATVGVLAVVTPCGLA